MLSLERACKILEVIWTLNKSINSKKGSYLLSTKDLDTSLSNQWIPLYQSRHYVKYRKQCHLHNLFLLLLPSYPISICSLSFKNQNRVRFSLLRVTPNKVITHFNMFACLVPTILLLVLVCVIFESTEKETFLSSISIIFLLGTSCILISILINSRKSSIMFFSCTIF